MKVITLEWCSKKSLAWTTRLGAQGKVNQDDRLNDDADRQTGD